MSINISIREESDITSLKNEWQQLDQYALQQIHDGKLKYIEYSFYQTYTWNSYIHKTYKHSKKKVYYTVVSADKDIKIIVPTLVNMSNKSIKIMTGNIAGIINIVCPYRDGPTIQTIVSVIQLLKNKYSNGWHVMLKNIPRHSLFMETFADQGFKFSERGSYHIPLKDYANYEEYISNLGKNMYKNIRKAYNHISTDGIDMKLHVYDKSNHPSKRLLLKIWILYYKRMLTWKHKKQTLSAHISCIFKAYKECLYGRQTRSMKELEQSELYVLTLNNKIAAFMHVYNHYGYALMPKLAINHSFSRYSPGILLLLESLKLMIKKGVKDFDMCRGDERYKKEIGGVMEPLAEIIWPKFN